MTSIKKNVATGPQFFCFEFALAVFVCIFLHLQFASVILLFNYHIRISNWDASVWVVYDLLFNWPLYWYSVLDWPLMNQTWMLSPLLPLGSSYRRWSMHSIARANRPLMWSNCCPICLALHCVCPHDPYYRIRRDNRAIWLDHRCHLSMPLLIFPWPQPGF